MIARTANLQSDFTARLPSTAPRIRDGMAADKPERALVALLK